MPWGNEEASHGPPAKIVDAARGERGGRAVPVVIVAARVGGGAGREVALHGTLVAAAFVIVVASIGARGGGALASPPTAARVRHSWRHGTMAREPPARIGRHPRQTTAGGLKREAA